MRSPGDGYMLLDLHGLDTYRNMTENGVMGGAFGDMGGWGHTVTLCPLTETEPTGQDFGKCGSFAVVSTYDVSAEVSRNSVSKSGTTFRESTGASVKDITVSLDPVEGKNLAGVDGPSPRVKQRPDDRHRRAQGTRLGTMAAGAYKLGLPDGWRAMDGSGNSATGALSPLADNLELDVTPSTATVYGFVRNTDGFGLENVTVTVNGMTATTDDEGRYIVSGISAVRGQLFVNTARAGYPATRPDSTNNPNNTGVPEFAANTTERHDFALHGANTEITISGTVTDNDTDAGIKGVEILVNYGNGFVDPNNATGSGSGRKLVTDDNGAYTAVVEAKPLGAADPLVTVRPTKSGWNFITRGTSRRRHPREE